MVGGTMKRLECVVAGTTDSGAIGTTTVGQLVVDGTVTWIVDNFFDPPVGTVRYALAIPDGWIKLSGGRLINGKLDYPRLWAWAVANDLVTYIDPIGDISAIDSNNSSKFWAFLGNVSPNQFYLPDFINYFMEGGNSPGSRISAGLPNITGEANYLTSKSMPTSNADNYVNASNNSLKWKTKMTTVVSTTTAGSNASGLDSLVLDASKSNSIYGKSNTVQPLAIQLYPIIKY